jgi:hypothetical protein
MNVQHPISESTNSSNLEAAVDTHLRGPWLMLARVGWFVLVLLGLAVFVASLPVYIAQLQSVCNGTACATGQLTPQIVETLRNLMLSMDSYVATRIAFTFVNALVWFMVGAVLFWRRSNDWMVLLVSLMLMLLGTDTTLTTVAGSQSIWQFPALLLDYFSYLLLILIMLLFPSGRFVPRWSWLLMIVFIPVVGQYTFLPNLPLLNEFWFNLLYNLLWIALVISVMATQIYRYRYTSNLVLRQQTKWVVFAISVILLVEVGFTIPMLFFPSLSQTGSLYWLVYHSYSSFSLLLIPISFGIAILRYQLWDIDIIINRTLVYGTLSGILAVIYFGLVLGMEYILGGFTGQLAQSNIAIVASTLAIAALFQPLRKRIQSFIDRRFYRRKYDAARILEAFSATLRNEVDLEQLREHLVAVVQETMEPAHVSLWFRTHNRRQESDEQARI